MVAYSLVFYVLQEYKIIHQRGTDQFISDDILYQLTIKKQCHKGDIKQACEETFLFCHNILDFIMNLKDHSQSSDHYFIHSIRDMFCFLNKTIH